MTSTELYIGVDLGTSSVKTIAVSTQGDVISEAKRGYTTLRPEPGASLQNPRDWLRATIEALAELRTQTVGDKWLAMGLAGMLPTLVVLNSRLEPLGNAVTWEDSRAELEAREFLSNHGSGLYERTGQRVDARYLIPMFERFRLDYHSEAISASKVCSAKDYLFAMLTGELLTDPSTATGFGCYDLQTNSWTEAVTLLPGVPQLAPSREIRSLQSAIAAQIGVEAGLPVILGAADSVLGALGLGVSKPGEVAYISGTSTVILGVDSQFNPDPRSRYLVTPMAEEGFGEEMDLLATGSAISWMSGLFGIASQAETIDLALQTGVQDAPVFLPYLAPGEQGALWRSDLRGTILNLSTSTSRADLVRGILNGIILESVRCLEVLRESNPSADLCIRASGWASNSKQFKQDLADASGCQVLSEATKSVGHTSLGAAILAARSTDQPEFEIEPELETFIPVGNRAEVWCEVSTQFEEARKRNFGGAT